EGARILSKYDINVTPPEIAREEYGKIGEILEVEDLFEEEKKEAIKEALKFKPLLKLRLLESKNPLYDACKIAVVGNVIDLGVHQSYDLKREIENIFEIEFKRNDFDEFKLRVSDSESVCYLADNAGENVFDELLIEEIKKTNPDVKIYYIVRGKPVINDVTVKDLIGLEIFELAEVVDSGVDTPGFHLKFANKISKEIFYNADMVISKGMGNFECLFGECGRDVFYLFKVKCEVVARASGGEVGDYMLFKGER
ncbi:MAG: ARMT1-like domain-containing protein, partial [Nautiliaceae bacterium]